MKARIIREPERKITTGISKSTWWRLEQCGKAPKRIHLSPNTVGWLESEINEWIQARAQESSN